MNSNRRQQNYSQDRRNVNRRPSWQQAAPSNPNSRPVETNPAEAQLARFQANLAAERSRELGVPNVADKSQLLALQPINEANVVNAWSANIRGSQPKSSSNANSDCCHVQHLKQSLDELKVQQDKTHERLDKVERLINKLFESLNKITATLDLSGLSLNLYSDSDQSDPILPGDLFDTSIGESYMDVSLANDSRSAWTKTIHYSALSD